MSRAARNRAARNNRGKAPVGVVSRNLIRSESVRTHVEDTRLSTGVRTRKNRRPGSDKGQGEWRTTSPYYRTSTTIDARWSA